MIRPRSEVAHLLAMVLVAGLAFAGLKHPSYLLASAIYTTTWGLLLASIICAICRDAPKRYFCSEFAVFGSAHRLIAYADSVWVDDANPKVPMLLTSLVFSLSERWIDSGYKYS
jgi:hypothetical protein